MKGNACCEITYRLRPKGCYRTVYNESIEVWHWKYRNMLEYGKFGKEAVGGKDSELRMNDIPERA